MDNAVYYVVALLMIIIGFVIVKKVAGCLVRSIVTIVLIALLVALYLYFKSTVLQTP